ncbi:MAG: HAMP domain-containing histidine kinase [Actinomycetia bacterium]|nr:HAMP domain-containing histidine kinase [Actinomycetes bacterium]MCH9801200.1 HAMP domain-containing histidine kinase [Actinomycetes bacterium]
MTEEPRRYWIGRRAGLANRVAFAFAMISLFVALLVSGATYIGTSIYLLQEREASALSRAQIDARIVDAALEEGVKEGRALDRLAVSEGTDQLLFVDGVWFATNVSLVPEDDIPQDLLLAAEAEGGAIQRFEDSTGDKFLAIAIAVDGGIFVDVFSLATLDQVLGILGAVVVGASIIALIVGGIVGKAAGNRLLRPLGDVADGARRITAGDMSARVPIPPDPDISAISVAFNDMAAAVQDRLERERRFSANVSHELRSPLTGIVGTADLLERRVDNLPEREANLVLGLGRQVRRFSAMVLDLLEISRIGGDQVVQWESIDVGLLIDEQLNSRGLSRSLRSGDDFAMMLDPRRFERIVANLIDNAQTHGDGLSAIEVERTGTGMRLTVDDSGPGIDPEVQDQIFEPFARGDGTQVEGAGLGLAIVAEQIRLLGGTVEVGQSPQGGARFLVELAERSPT